jgi:hypothetical protein
MIKTDLQDLIGFFETLQGLLKGGPLGDWADRTTRSLQEMGASMQDAAENAAKVDRIRVTPAAPKYTGVDPFGLNAPKADTKDPYDREVASINKHIAAMQADAATVRDGAYAQEEFRVQMLLSEKAAEANKDMTLELNDAIAAQATRAAEAKQALAEHQFQLQKMNAASQTVGQALSTAFADAIVEGKSLNDVLKSLITTLEKAAINSAVMSLFTPGAGQSVSAFSKLLGFAGGTDYAPGGMAVVGESGPELVNLPRGSQVIPNSVARNMGGGGVTVAPTYNIDATGADPVAIARLQAALVATNRSIESRAVAAINSHMARGG